MNAIFIDPSTLPPGAGGTIQVLSLCAAYSYLLFHGSNMIADGSELMLLYSGKYYDMVGSVVLPILGAVPDGAIVLFSGLSGGPTQDVQKTISVGVGALAGSTIMLLTIPWVMSILGGRVNLIEEGGERKANYSKPKSLPPVMAAAWSKLNPPNNWSLTGTGVSCGATIRQNGKIMMATSLIYLLIQGPAFASKPGQMLAGEKTYALIGFLICFAAFVGYILLQIYNANLSKDITQEKLLNLRQDMIKSGQMSISGAMFAVLQKWDEQYSQERGDGRLNATELTGLNPERPGEQRSRELKKVLKPFFDKYDTDNSGTLDGHELLLLFRDLHEPAHIIEGWMALHDVNNDKNIDFDEFCGAMVDFVLKQGRGQQEFDEEQTEAWRRASVATAMQTVHHSLNSTAAVAADDEDEEEEEDEIPDDLQDLSPEQQMRRIKIRSAYLMGLGTLMVLLISDPMVSVLDEIGNRSGIPAFYISFVLAPLASNASEVIASFQYAQKKTQKTITIAFSTLLGAACMNNTFCLGIFLALIYCKGLEWQFSAETIAIVLVQLIMGVVAYKQVHTLRDGLLVLTLYPLSLILVAVLEACGMD